MPRHPTGGGWVLLIRLLVFPIRRTLPPVEAVQGAQPGPKPGCPARIVPVTALATKWLNGCYNGRYGRKP